MEDYAELYALLFRAITDAIEQLDALRPGKARETLVCAQQAAEELYIGGGEAEL